MKCHRADCSKLILVFLLYLLAAVLSVCYARAQGPESAVIRIGSHGASGTIIKTENNRSWILSCAHMFADIDAQGLHANAQLLRRPLRIDGPPQPQAKHQRGVAKVVGVDFQSDLSLIEIANGPFFHVPVAPLNHRPAGQLLSLGYDEMRWPVTRQRATLHSMGGLTLFTHEKPWHGRSGGALIDANGPYLVGVVQGYEVSSQGRGLYVNLRAIHAFLNRHLSQQRTPPYQCPLPNR